MNTTVTMHGDHPVLRLERLLNHPPDKVWHAITDPTELSHWFPARIDFDHATPGAPMSFTFDGTEPEHGEILEIDPLKVFAFRWNDDVIRCELLPRPEGCLLVFSHTLRAPDSDLPSTARHAAGWDGCLDALDARLSGTTAEFDMQTWFHRAENYIEQFGLAEGELHRTDTGWQIHFTRDLVQPPAQVWALLTGDTTPTPGSEPPLPSTHGYGTAGPVITTEAPHTLEYAWQPTGTVRFHLRDQHPIGTRLHLTHTTTTDPATLLAAWHTHLELLFAALHDDIRCPWPTDRTEALRDHYAQRFDLT
ncbi:SRPBCC family protein [Saccharopolyspora oryzae]|uniref:SRPBCC family protein n=1 Tax=Saccharopolyspora oryzae TaxID=2997343 RepID=A0ABT4V109_9PSEU|nr:SRPBCC family protein [Saccharopolyspora oryzae]MDA3627645.1 SRPBCC family protein [Saccharopolyspora oryzae]